ncbi:MAG: protein-L-isoaspartate(D-aspartate) O-methyltransferase [Proteobacteria bacterium]|nr:protein-L-isoaspartate(D-aspartate) O-methyltransferase [Pseudomonadota bacterium]
MQRRPGFPARLDRPPAAAPAAVAAGVRVPREAQPPMPQGVGLDSAAVRARMVQRLAAAGITAAPVLQAMGAVQRHGFVDSALANQAYEETSLPIGLGQTISKPGVVARMTELLLGADGARAQGLGRVLEIGTGCGYQAAVLARLAREVYTVERLRALHEKARDNLRPLRLANVHLILGDGMLGYAAGAPYAGIICAAGGDSLPPQWCEQLAVGGRLVAPMAGADGRQLLLVVDKTPQGLKQSVLEAVHFVPLKSGVA